jgi:pimeloyl-ACP methyl ester carboxylesterase
MSRSLVPVLAGLLLVGPAATASLGAGPVKPTYEVVSCESEQFAGRLPTDMEIVCGLLTVSEDRREPMGPGNEVVLPVAILAATGSDPQPDPLVMLNGNLGVGAFEYYMGAYSPGQGVVPSDYLLELLEDRDVILMDHRGAGRAVPSTACPASSQLDTLLQLLSTPGGLEEEKAVLHANLTACVESIRAQGVDLDHYDRANLAQDLSDLRRALGIRTWNAYGHSAGGNLALELLRQDHAALRSVVLDAAVPPYEDIDSLASTAESAKRGFEAIAAAHGVADLESRLEALVAKFDADPYAPTGTLAEGLTLTGTDVPFVLLNGMYVTDFIPLLDLFVTNLELFGTEWAFDLGELLGFPAGLVPTVFDLFAAFIPQAWGDTSDGVYVAVLCSRSELISARTTIEGNIAAFGVYGIPPVDFPQIPQLCDGLGIQPDAQPVYKVRDTPVPTLVRHGNLDIAVPPEWSLELSQRLGDRSQYLEFPMAGHWVQEYGQCAIDTLTAFFAEPGQPVDASCIGG